jgi:anti-sigma factor RsiW
MSAMNTDQTTGDREHPSDLLPDYARGTLAPARERQVASHLNTCSECADELELLTVLAGQPHPTLTAEERRLIFDRIGFGHERSGGRDPGTSLWSPIWKVAAGLAFLATGVGVWQVYLAGTSATGWSAAPALEAWEQDVQEIDPSAEGTRALLAFIGPSSPELVDGSEADIALDGVVDEVLDGLDPGVLDGIAVPWEEEQ